MSDSLSNPNRPVEAKSAANLLSEGDELRDQIANFAQAGRPAWRIRYLYVPRMPFRAGNRGGYIQPTAIVDGIPYGGKVRPAVAASLAQREPWPHEWTPHELVQLRRFYIAALVDIAGVKEDSRDHRVNTTRDRDIRIGRALWASMWAWPWSLFAPDGWLPSQWRQDKLVIEWWQAWTGNAY